MKVCNICKIEKPLAAYKKSATNLDGLYHFCKQCVLDKRRKVQRTPLGLIKGIYDNQLSNSRVRGYALPDYDGNQLYLWYTRQPQHKELFKAWVDSGYDSDLMPSVDRIDDYKPYTRDNIQLITWKENNIKLGKNQKQYKPVRRGDGKIFESITDAVREFNGSTSLIARVCRSGGLAYGYTWSMI